MCLWLILVDVYDWFLMCLWLICVDVYDWFLMCLWLICVDVYVWDAWMFMTGSWWLIICIWLIYADVYGWAVLRLCGRGTATSVIMKCRTVTPVSTFSMCTSRHRRREDWVRQDPSCDGPKSFLLSPHLPSKLMFVTTKAKIILVAAPASDTYGANDVTDGWYRGITPLMGLMMWCLMGRRQVPHHLWG